MLFNTPVLFLIFNRPDTTKQVFEKIREIKPKYLYVAADGPRSDKSGEGDLCEATRNVVLKNIDWDCELKTLLRNENLGCGLAVSGAINWFFENVEEGIILEDDTLADISFFNYCEVMLEKYRENKKVLHISGSSYANPNLIEHSYYFTRLPFIWGWATWSRAWKQYNFDTKYYSAVQKTKILNSAFSNQEIVDYWSNILTNFHLLPKSFTWDYQWFLSIWEVGGLVIQPKVNLVKNIGFGEDATHTTSSNHVLASVESNYLDIVSFKEDTALNAILENENFNFYFKNPVHLKYKKHFFNDLRKRIIQKVKYGIGQVLFKFIQNYKGVKVDNTNVHYPKDSAENATFGKNTVIKSQYNIISSTIGDFTFIDENAHIENTHIGKFSTIGSNFISGGNIPQPKNLLATSPMFSLSKKYNGISLCNKDKFNNYNVIKIGNDVSIGQNVLIVGGVSISDGVIIMPGTVVTENVPPYAIIAGNPMCIIGYRFDDSIIKKLLNIKWWDWKEEDLHKIEENITIEQFLKEHISNTLNINS